MGKSKIDRLAIGHMVINRAIQGVRAGKLSKDSSLLDVAEAMLPEIEQVSAASVAAALGGALISPNKAKSLAKIGALVGASYVVHRRRQAVRSDMPDTAHAEQDKTTIVDAEVTDSTDQPVRRFRFPH